MPAQNPFDYVGIPGFDPYLPGAQQRYGDLSTQGRLEVLGEKRKREEKIAQQEQAQQVLQQIYQQYPDKPELAVVELRRRGFLEQADKLETHVSQQKKSVLEQRKLELDILRANGQIEGDAADRELKAMAAKSPQEMLKLYAGVTSPEEHETAVGMMRFRFGDAAEPVIAMLGTFDPAKAQFAGRTVMGPAAVADDARQVKVAEAAAANQVRDDQRAIEAAAALEAYRKEQLSQGRQRIAQSGQRIAQTGGGGASGTSAAALPPQARAVVARVVTGMPGTRVGPIYQEVNRLAASGDEAALKSFLRYAATQKVGEARQTAMQGRMETLAALKDAETLLRQVPTGLIKGTWEDTARALGETTDPRMVDLGTRMGVILSRYMQSVSGAAISDEEAKRLTPHIPNYKNKLSVNLGVIKGFSGALKSFDNAFYRNTFGENYDWVMSPGASASSKPGAPKKTAEELIKLYGGR